jgi:hypothetical protein
VGRGADGIIWTIPDDPEARPFPLGDATATFSSAATNHSQLDLLTVTHPDGKLTRMASRGVSRGALVDAAATLVRERQSDDLVAGRRSLPGLADMAQTFAGPQATGPLLSSAEAVRMTLRHRSGATVSLLVSTSPFDRAATSWFFQRSDNVDIRSEPGLLAQSDDGAILLWSSHDLSFMLTGSDESSLHEISSAVADAPPHLWSHPTRPGDEEPPLTTTTVHGADS